MKFNLFFRICPFPRSISAFLNKYEFPEILDRYGLKPSFVDPLIKRQINTDIEVKSLIGSNEIVIQFMALLK